MPTLASYRIYGLTLTSDYRFVTPVLPSQGQGDLVFSHMHAPPSVVDELNTLKHTTPITESAANQTNIFVYQANSSRYILECRDAMIFHIEPQAIKAYTLHREDSTILEILMLGPALALWRYLQGKLGLHASAVDIDGKAVIFSAYKHSGKSTLAASFLNKGYALLADDYAAIESEPGVDRVHPGYPDMRMWEDQASYFVPNYQNLPMVLPTSHKRIVPIGAGGYGKFCTESRPLTAIYLPQRTLNHQTAGHPQIEPVTKASAVAILMRNGVVANLRSWLPFHQHNMRLLAELVARIPVRSLTYPSGYDNLPDVTTAILEDFNALTR